MRLRTVLTVAVVVTALVGCSEDEPSAEPSAEPTSLAQIEVDEVRLARVDFCDRVADSAVRRALGADPTGDEAWGNGDPAPGTSGDVAHEVGCAWNGPARTSARAWVFARPVAADLAESLVRRAGDRRGCETEPARGFGRPALGQSCTLPDGTTRVRRAGLFGDTWLTCELTLSPADADGGAPDDTDLPDRTDTWCATVLTALDTTP